MTKQTTNLNLNKPDMADQIALTISQLGSNFDILDASITNNTTALAEKAKQTNVSNIMLDVKNPPASFGLIAATGDGVTDDSAAVQAMINYVSSNGGGTVFLSKGTYNLSNISLNSKVRLIGVGRGKTVIKLSSTTKQLFYLGGIVYVEISDLTIDFNNVEFSFNPFNLNNCTDVNIHDIDIKNLIGKSEAVFKFYKMVDFYLDKIKLTNVTKSPNLSGFFYVAYGYDLNQNLRFKRIRSDAQGSKVSGIYLDNFNSGSDNVTIDDIYINGFELYGVNILSATRLKITNSNFLNAVKNDPTTLATNPPCAIKINTSQYVYVGKNKVTDAGEIGLYYCNDYIVDENHVDRPVSAGIELNANDFGTKTYPSNNFRGKVINNTVYGSYNSTYGAGIFFQGGDGVISNNNIEKVAERGITVAQNAANVVVSNNVVKNSNQSLNSQPAICVGLINDNNPTQNVVVSNNLIFDDQATHTQAYGIQLFAMVKNILINGNTSYGNTIRDLQIDSSVINQVTQYGNSWNPKWIYGTSAPTTGTYKMGDRCITTTPTAGQPKSWVCTVAGTPGTWVSEGNL